MKMQLLQLNCVKCKKTFEKSIKDEDLEFFKYNNHFCSSCLGFKTAFQVYQEDSKTLLEQFCKEEGITFFGDEE